MSDSKKHILIVDDSPEDIQFIMENLKDKFSVLVGINGKRGIELADGDVRPDVILMDVSMPEMDGFDACRKLKENPATQDIDVIFISADDSIEAILTGYDVGGSDYVTKPVNPEELFNKIELSLAARELRFKLKNEKAELNEAFMTSLVSASELGYVLNFLRNTFAVKDIDELGKMVVKSLLSDSQIKSTVQIRILNEIKNYSSDAHVTPMESELLYRSKDGGRILSHGKRLIVNFGDLSVLIKNMPLDNPDLCGRIRDNIAIMMEGADSRAQALKSLIEQHANNLQIMHTVMEDLEEHFLVLDLTEEQEQLIVTIVEKGMKGVIGDV